MAVDQTANFVRGGVPSSIGSSETTISVDNASIYPDPSNGEYNLVLWDADEYRRPDLDPNVEIVRVTGRDTTNDTLTVTRGQENTTAENHPNTSNLQLAPTSKVFTDIDTSKVERSGDTMTGDLSFDDGNAANWGTDVDFSISYESATDELVITDEENDVELIRQPKQGSTQFLQGADIGSIEAPEDSFTQLANASVTSTPTSGDRVGYTLALDNQSFFEIDGEADGSGGIQNTTVDIPNSDLNLSSNTIDAVQQINLQETVQITDSYGKIETGGSGSGTFAVRDGANAQDIALFDEGGNVEIPNGALIIPNTIKDVNSIIGDNVKINITDSFSSWELDTASSFTVKDDIDGNGLLTVEDTGNVEIPNGDLRLATDQNIEDGSGTRRIGVKSYATQIYDESGRVGVEARSDNRAGAVLHKYDEGGRLIRDENGDFNAVSYTTSASAPGTLSLDNAELHLGGNDIKNVDGIKGGVQYFSLETRGNSNDKITVYDTLNSQDIARFNQGGNVEIPNGALDMGGNAVNNADSITATAIINNAVYASKSDIPEEYEQDGAMAYTQDEGLMVFK